MTDDDNEILWEDPPKQRQGVRLEWTITFSERCREHPGKWARVRRPDGSDRFSASTISILRHRGLEVRSSKFGEDGRPISPRIRMWARWPDE